MGVGPGGRSSFKREGRKVRTPEGRVPSEKEGSSLLGKKERATEKIPPYPFIGRVRVKRWGKSPPVTG